MVLQNKPENMDEKQLEELSSNDTEKIISILKEFNRQNANLFNFDDFHSDGQWYSLWRTLFDILNNNELAAQHVLCLNTVRILTRDEFSLQTQDILTDVDALLRLAQISGEENIDVTHGDGTEAVADIDTETWTCPPRVAQRSSIAVVAESLKCLCNLVFQSVDCRRYCVRQNAIDAVLKRVASSTQHPCAVELYDMKLLFLFTALEPSARSRVQLELNGTAYMTEWLDEMLGDAEHSDEQIELLCEMLKVMFNITTSPDKSPNENEIQSLHLTGVIRDMLIRFGAMDNIKERNVVMHATNLLTNISSDCLAELVVKCGLAVSDESEEVLYFEGRNVRALEVLLRHLHSVLEELENVSSANQLVAPALTVLVKCARSNSIMRHYIRSVVLPPLRDVSKRPEEGTELRNYLCRQLTQSAMIVRDLAAELLFVCCKENVGRMIKYTGYGNAAGLFANRGLLDCRQMENGAFSSDSEDSDTEEYKQVQHNINPVLGCYEPTKTNPLEGMSAERKEFEAMELVKLMNQLHKSGIVQPCTIGEDGKPQPVDHILQLQEELPQQQLEAKRKT